MKKIRFFLDEEDKYCQTEPEEIMIWDEEAQEWDYKRIPLDFLRSRPFQQSYNNLEYKRERTQGYNLSDAELTVLGMFIMHHSQFFRDDYYGNVVPEIAQNMFEVLDSSISKAPITEHATLYRFCEVEDKHDMKVGEVFFIPHNLTCTSDKWDRNDRNIYIIQTLPSDKTQAHDIYKMYPHNENEHQVNFLRGTKFLVTAIKDIFGTVYHEFYMEELEQ